MDYDGPNNPEMTIQDKCATLPARVMPHGDSGKPRTLHWMAVMVGEMEGSLNPNQQHQGAIGHKGRQRGKCRLWLSPTLSQGG